MRIPDFNETCPHVTDDRYQTVNGYRVNVDLLNRVLAAKGKGDVIPDLPLGGAKWQWQQERAV